MIKLNFKRVDVLPSELVIGTIYFEENTKLIKVAKSSTEYTTYGDNESISNASFENNKLIITYKDGSTNTLDFSSIDSAQDLMPVFKELNTKIEAVNYKFGWYNSDKVEEDVTVEQLELLTYGVQWDSTIADPHLTRIGNPLLHKTLPIQSELKGCIVNGNVLNYWLDPNDWSRKLDGTPSVLDGTDGTVRVHVPRFYGKSGTEGTKSWVRISTTKIDSSWTEIPEMYIDAYQCTVDTSDPNNYKAVSVVNTSPEFRGGNNDTSYDQYLDSDPFRSNLGKQRTRLSRATMRTYAKNAGSELLCYEYYKWIFYWLYVIEYANFNCQEAYNPKLTESGYHQGGLGVGVTILSHWSDYNAANPIIYCGIGNNIGNSTGIIEVEPRAFKYRTIANPIVKWNVDKSVITYTISNSSIIITNSIINNKLCIYSSWKQCSGTWIYHISGLTSGQTILFKTNNITVATASSDGNVTVDWGVKTKNREIWLGFTGECNITISVVTSETPEIDLQIKNMDVPRWRGFDNPFGHIWTNLDGIIIQSIPNSSGKYFRHIYTTTDITKFGDDELAKESMTLQARVLHIDGWIKTFSIDSKANIIPSWISASASTYMCDATWSGVYNNDLRTLLVGGNATAGSLSGFGAFNSHYGVGYPDVTVGFRTLTKI